MAEEDKLVHDVISSTIDESSGSGTEASGSPVQDRPTIAPSNPLIGNADVISCVSAFVADDLFLFSSSVRTDWRRAWGKPSKMTTAVTVDTSVSLLEHCFECGLGDSSTVCENAARLGRLDLLQCARAHFCWFGETCTVAYECAQQRSVRRQKERYEAYKNLFLWARARGCAWTKPESSVTLYDPRNEVPVIGNDHLGDFVRGRITGDIVEVPGISLMIKEFLAKEELGSITNTYQLIGKFLSMKPDEDDCQDHCDKFWVWLRAKGVHHAHSKHIVRAIAEKVYMCFPGIYEYDLWAE